MAPSGTRTFIDAQRISRLLKDAAPSAPRVREVLSRAGEMKGLSSEDAAVLLSVDDETLKAEILETAGRVKQAIYGQRIVLFAPLYIGNRCSNDCLYCAFRSANKRLSRRSLDMDEIEAETRALLREGHKRVLMLSGEDATEGIERLVEAIGRVYSVRERSPRTGREATIRRINVEVAPLSVEEFARLKAARIGTYACFQETYDPDLYAAYHRFGPKADYRNRLYVMDRAMEGGIDDVGIGALFGLGDFRFEALGLLAHAAHLEEQYGCGPHTISVPRIEPAEGAPTATQVPHPLTDDQFRLLVATLRLALPYTGIILSTRENETLRDELFRYGISQISAGSRTNPGAYSDADGSGSQFQLGDHRNLSEVVSRLGELGYVPSFCTGCYRKGRVGADFMELAKPGLIKRFCEPNALFTFAEYLEDFGEEPARLAGAALAERTILALPDDETRRKTRAGLSEIAAGGRDIYL